MKPGQSLAGPMMLIAAAAFVFAVRGVLAPFVVAGMLAYILVPAVEAVCARLRLRRGVIVSVLFLFLLLAVGGGVAVIEPALARESKDLVLNAPAILTSLFIQVLGSEKLEVLGTTVAAGPLADRLLAAARDALGRPTEALHMAEAALRGVLDILLVLIVLFYLLLDWDKLVAFAFRLVPAGRRDRVGAVASSIHLVLGRYIRGQLYLVLLMAGVTWLALAFGFHLKYALPIALLTGVLEVIPYVGPVAAAAIAASVAVSQDGGQMAIGVVVFYTIARQVEDQIVMPLVVGRAVHLHPVATLFAVVCGGAIAGVLGMVLAVPTAAALAVILDDVVPNSQTQSKQEQATGSPS